MKVAILTENLAFGGINRYCLALAQGLKEYPRVELEFLALPSAGDDWLLRGASAVNVEVEVLASESVRSLRRTLSGHGVDVVHSQGYRSNIVSRLALRCGRSSAKSVCTVHGAYYFASAPWRSRAYYGLDYLTMFLSDRVVAVSAATADQISPWARGNRVVVIHNGTSISNPSGEPAKAAAREALGIPNEAKVVCFVGRFDPQKGIGALTKIMAEVLASSGDLVFLLVGDGTLRLEVEACARRFGRRAIMVGAQREVDPFYVASDLILLPSRSEGLPMALIEAFAHGLPAVASKVGGVPEVLVEGWSGFLCEREDTDTMARRILELAHDDALRARMGANARETVAAKFLVSGMVEATYRMYVSLVKENE